MRLNHNSASLSVYMSYSKSLSSQSISLEKISSGCKINNAKDSPDGIAESERIRMQVRGLQMSSRNSQDGVSMLQTAEGGLNGMTEMLQRMRQLVVQAGSGSNTSEDKKTIQDEIDQMIDGMDSIANNTEFNGIKLLSKENDLEMLMGSNAGETVIIPQRDVTSANLKTLDGKSLEQLKSGNSFNIADSDNVSNALDIIDQTLNTIVSMRSKYGALENRFQENYDGTNEMSNRLQAEDSEIRDTDIGEEMANYSKASILVQAGNAMMAQTNKLPQDALKILENVRSK